MQPSPVKSAQKPSRVLFFGRENCAHSKKALNSLFTYGFDVTYVESRERGEDLSNEIMEWRGDYILCFRSLFIVPKEILARAAVAAINFHPGPPEYPGSGCVNFALYENSEFFGVTAHIMSEEVDQGDILRVLRFPVLNEDSLTSLLRKTHQILLDLFNEVIAGLSKEGHIYVDRSTRGARNEKWAAKARKIADLEKLQVVKADVSEDELSRIIRATHLDNFPVQVEIHGFFFALVPPESNPPKTRNPLKKTSRKEI